MGVAEGGRVLCVKLSEEAVKAALVGENARVPRSMFKRVNHVSGDRTTDTEVSKL